MHIKPETYIDALQARIDNWYRRNQWHRDAYCTMLRLSDDLNQIRHRYSEGENVQRAMLALNNKLLTREARMRRGGVIFLRSAQSRANIISRSR